MNVLTIIAVSCPIVVTMVLSVVIAAIICFLARRKTKKRNKIFHISILVSMSILWISILYITNNPIIYCPTQLKPLLTDGMKEDIRYYNKGLYSTDYPAFPVYIQIISIVGNKVEVRVNYSTLGTTEMEIDNGLPSNTKKMFGW